MPRERGPQLAQTERLLYLRTAEAFAELPARDLAALAEHARERVFEPGAALMREGEPCRALYMIVDGRVQLARGGETVGHAGSRAGIATLALMAQREAPATAVAETETMTLELAREPLMELLSDNFPMLQSILRMLARGLIRSRGQLGAAAGYRDRPPNSRDCPARSLDLVERVRFLREVIPFARAQVSALVDLARHSDERRLEAGEVLWREGEATGWSDLVFCGTVRGEADAGRQRFYFGDGASVGALDNLAAAPRWYTATAESTVVALRITAEQLLDLFADRFEIAHAFLKMIAGELLDLLDARGIFEGHDAPLEHGAFVPGGPGNHSD